MVMEVAILKSMETKQNILLYITFVCENVPILSLFIVKDIVWIDI